MVALPAGLAVAIALVAYRDRIASRPAFARAMQVNFPPEALAALARR